MPRSENPLTREQLVRRLTAIFAADVAGYSRLTGMDEEGTHVRLKEHLRVLIDPMVPIVDTSSRTLAMDF
jgi:class 3 adenylate cyclase